MIALTTKADLADAVATVLPAIAGKTPLECYKHIVIEVNDHPEPAGEVRGMNEDLAIRTELPCINIEHPGTCSFPATDLSALVRQLPDGYVTIVADEFKGAIRWNPSGKFAEPTNDSEFVSPAIDLDCMPIQPDVEVEDPVCINAPAFAKLVGLTSGFTRNVTYHDPMSGVLIEVGPRRFRVTTTNGHVVATSWSDPLSSLDEVKHGVKLVHPKALAAAAQCVAADGTSVKLGWDSNHLRLDLEKTCVHISLMDPGYPDWRRIMPKEFAGTAKVDRALFEQAVRRANIGSGKWQRVHLDFGEDAMRVWVPGNRGVAGDLVPIEFDGKPQELVFNAPYVINVLSRLLGDKVEVSHCGHERVVQFTSPDDEHTIFIIQPMRVD